MPEQAKKTVLPPAMSKIQSRIISVIRKEATWLPKKTYIAGDSVLKSLGIIIGIEAPIWRAIIYEFEIDDIPASPPAFIRVSDITDWVKKHVRHCRVCETTSCSEWSAANVCINCTGKGDAQYE